MRDDMQSKNARSPLAILQKRRVPGMVMFTPELAMAWLNAEARTIFDMKLAGGDAAVEHPVIGRVRTVAGRLLRKRTEKGTEVPEVDVLIDGEHTYGLRAMVMASAGAEHAGACMVLVSIEAICMEREVDFDGMRQRYGISRREQDVLRMLYYGKTNREIGELLFISEHTVKDHIKSIMSKMDASTRAEVLYKLTVAS